jgi:glycosyltransferase involved in cell wall biosynthesis
MTQGPLRLLCVEPSFPGRLGAVADWLVRRRGYHCWFFCHFVGPQAHWPPAAGRGLEVVRFPIGGVAQQTSATWTRLLERGLCYANGALEALEARRPSPLDLVLGRSAGVGSTLFVPAYAPRAPIVNLFDYFHHPHAHDFTGEPDCPATPDYFHWRRTACAMDVLDLENGVHPWVPTPWQRDLFPPEYHADFTVLFDGVATVARRRSEWPRVVLGHAVPPGTRVVTFVARWLECLRGFDRFLHLANRLLAAFPDVLCVAVGSSPVRRGLDVQHFGRDYAAERMRHTPPADPARLLLPGEISASAVQDLLAASDLHVYPARPYPVSRSLVEAMAAGCVVLAWDTPPVREVLAHGQTGLLTDDDPDAAFALARAVLTDAAGHRPLGDAAAERVRQCYAQEVTLPVLAEWFGRLAEAGG